MYKDVAEGEMQGGRREDRHQAPRNVEEDVQHRRGAGTSPLGVYRQMALLCAQAPGGEKRLGKKVRCIADTSTYSRTVRDFTWSQIEEQDTQGRREGS